MGEKGRPGTHCLRMRVNFPTFQNSVLRTDNSVFKHHDRILSGLLHGILRVREVLDLWNTSAEKHSYLLSIVFTTCLWNTGK